MMKPALHHRPTPSALASSHTLEQKVEWHGIALNIPGDWEIARHGLSPALGTLCFVDRRRERLSLSWAACASAPGLDRIIHELQAELASVERFHWGDWQGVAGLGTTGLEARAVKYDPQTKRLLSLAAAAPGPRELDLIRSVAMSAELRARATPLKRYRAFGLDVVVPAEYELRGAKVAPGDVTLRFERAAARAFRRVELIVRRWGMARSWFDGDFHRLLCTSASGVTYGDLELNAGDPVPCARATGRLRETRLVRLFGRSREERALLWRSPDENAVHALRCQGPKNGTPDPAAFVPALEEAR